MAKSAKQNSAGVDSPSAVADGGAPDSEATESGAAAETATVPVVVTAVDRAEALLATVAKMGDGVGQFHAEVEKAARDLKSAADAALHGRVARLASVLAEFRNGLGTV
jgi:hypothetical protein